MSRTFCLNTGSELSFALAIVTASGVGDVLLPLVDGGNEANTESTDEADHRNRKLGYRAPLAKGLFGNYGKTTPL